MDQATLDIKYSELLQWLLDRYLIPKDWPNRLEIIKSKKAEVIETLFNSDNEDFQKIKKMFKIFESTPIDSISYNDYQKLYQQLTKSFSLTTSFFFEVYIFICIISCCFREGLISITLLKSFFIFFPFSNIEFILFPIFIPIVSLLNLEFIFELFNP